MWEIGSDILLIPSIFTGMNTCLLATFSSVCLQCALLCYEEIKFWFAALPKAHMHCLAPRSRR